MRRFHALFLGAVALLAVAATPLLLMADDDSAVGSGTLTLRTPPPSTTVGSHPAAVQFGAATELDPSRDALLILAPASASSEEEVGAISRFLSSGGRVLVADDGAAGADLLSRLAAGVRLSLTPVYSPSFEVDPRRVLARSTNVLTTLPGELPLSRPMLVEGGEALLLAPELSWADRNENGRPDLDEQMTAGALAVRARVGDGELLVVGDPDALRPDSAAFAPLLDHLASGGRRVVVHEGHRAGTDPLALQDLLAGRAGAVVSTGILITTLAVATAVVLGPRLRATREPKRPVSRIRDVPPARLQQILQELKSE